MNPFEAQLSEHRYISLRKYEREEKRSLERLPYAMRILLENLLRHVDSPAVTPAQINAVAGFDGEPAQNQEVVFFPARVVLQDFTGVPSVVDLAAMRNAMTELGGDPAVINPAMPAELVIDHSVQVDSFAHPNSLTLNREHEYQRNRERYQLLRWAQGAFKNLRVVPPATGIVHQVNLEYLAHCVVERQGWLFPDTLVGTDSHTTMINGLGVLGWGVGGIEAEAAMLGEPIGILLPEVLGVRIVGSLRPGVTATDLVLTLTERLRQVGVVSKFVEFFGSGLAHMSLETRATISNMSPEFGSTAAIFPIDEQTLRYLRNTGRSAEHTQLVERYARDQGLFYDPARPEAQYSQVIEFDLDQVAPCLSGPARPQDRLPLEEMKEAFNHALPSLRSGKSQPPTGDSQRELAGLGDGSVVIAAITSCTNTSNPDVMFCAALLARNAVSLGLKVAPWVKTSLAPGSKVVTSYLRESGLMPSLEALGFHVVGYGCTTCIGNSGPLPEPVAKAVKEQNLVVASVLSGNRNFEGRINSLVRANYLASPPLVVAYALAGRVNIDFEKEALGQNEQGQDIFLRDLWPEEREIQALIDQQLSPESFHREYASVFDGDEEWKKLETPVGQAYQWDADSSYIQRPPFFEGLSPKPAPLEDIRNARVLLSLGDSITTDHISPAGSIPEDSAAGRYLIERGISPLHFNSYGSRRGNHEVMMRGTFANTRIQNRLVPGREGGYSRHLPSGEVGTVFEISQRYQAEKCPLIVLAGKEYGSGSSRDWAAKGTLLLGVRAVVAESYERIHRSNLVCMGVLPLQFAEGENAASLGLTGEEIFTLCDLEDTLRPHARLRMAAQFENGDAKSFWVVARIDTEVELSYYRHGGILQSVLRRFAQAG